MIPLNLQQLLLDLSRRLAPAKRGGFLRAAAGRVEDLARANPSTLAFSCVGYVAGRVIHALTGLEAALPGFLLGALFGQRRDLDAEAAERAIRRVIEEELARHAP